MAVVAIVVGIALPALSQARSTARQTRCLSNLRGIVQLQIAFATSMNKDVWPNDLPPDSLSATWTFVNTEFVSGNVLDQSIIWPGPLLRNGFLSSALPADGLACPIVLAATRTSSVLDNPHGPPIYSYSYSAAFFTSSDLWNPRVPQRRSRPDDWRRKVQLSDIAFPSSKVIMFERADYHGRGDALGAPESSPSMHTNVACADASATRVRPANCVPALPIEYPQSPDLIVPSPLPFSCAPWGSRGRDW